MSGDLFSQDSRPSLKQFWFDYNYSYAWKPKVDLYGDGGFRWLSPISTYKLLARPSIRFVPPGKVYEVHGGLGLFYAGSNNLVNVLEVRPFQGFRLNWPRIGKQVFHNYFRLEERWFVVTNDGDNAFDLRFRWQLATTVALKRNAFTQYYYLPLAAEVFGNANNELKRFQDALRLTAGLGYVFSGPWTGQFEFIYQRSRDAIDNDFDASDLIFRFRVFHKIPTKGQLEKLFDTAD